MKTKGKQYFLLGKKIKYIITSIFKCAARYTVFLSCHFKNLQYLAFQVKYIFKSYCYFFSMQLKIFYNELKIKKMTKFPL